MTNDYLLIGTVWSIYAVRRQIKLHGVAFWPAMITFVFNLFLWPIGVAVAIWRGE